MNKLNREQIRSVKHRTGPLLIIAGAGTGKTTVITERIVYLIEKGLAEPEEILALTFTEKASQEMEERVDIALPLGINQLWISTFHAFCDRVLREKGLEIGLDTKFKLLTQAQTMKLVKDNLFEFDLDYFRPLGNPTKFMQGLLVHFSRLQDENVMPDKYLKWVAKFKADKQEKDKWMELANAYKYYSDLKTKYGYLDFGDLITRTIYLFEKRPNVLKEYRQKFKYILVDEFQDTNFAQNILITKLSAKNGNITVVGDDDQSIYKFRGASVSNILQFRKYFPKHKTVVLNKNYRSLQQILELSYSVIQNNNPDRLEAKEKIDKRLIAQRKGKSEIEIIKSKTDLQEAESVAKKIIKLSKEYKYKDFAVLVRANNHADVFIKTFERMGIPQQFLGPAKLFQQQEIIDLISYLKVLDNLHDDLSLTRLLSVEELKIRGRQISDASYLARKTNKSLFEVIEEDSQFSEIVALIKDHIERKYKEMAGNLLYEFLKKSNILENLLKGESEQDLIKANNISKFFEKIKNQENSPESSGTVSEIVDWIDLSLELGDSPQASEGDWQMEDKVNILTIHSAKGLEFPVVFIPNMVHLRFPSTNKKDQIPIPEELVAEELPEKDFHLEEERRLFYVAMTRARDKLFFTQAQYYGDAKRAKKPSQFLLETGLEETFSDLNALSVQKKKNIKAKEKKPLKKIKISKLSFSQIESFKICPLHYKLAYILKIPTPDSASLSLGISVHEAMYDIFSQIKDGKVVKSLDLDSILDKNWQNRGFLDKKHSNQAKTRALGYIEDYFKNEYKKQNVIALEHKFSLNLGKNLKITGKIDRIDDLGSKIEIIDYKTGSNVPSQSEVDKNLQLSIYAMAAQEMYKEPVILSLYYFEEGKKISTKRSKQQLNEAKKHIFEVREDIQNSSFECSGHYFCNSCEYSLFCKQQKR